MNTFDPYEYLDAGRAKDGLSRCNKLLKKAPNHFTLLHAKAILLRELEEEDEAQATMKSLMGQPTFPKDVKSIQKVEQFFFDDLRASSLHSPLTLGSEVNALWTSAGAAVPRQAAIDISRSRFDGALDDGRWIDAGYALSAWRKLDPNNKTLRSLHAAVYQLIADNVATDPKTAMMNGMLAVRTLEQNTDTHPSEPELMLYCQVCTRQNKLRNITDRLKPIVESPQCTWSVLREYRIAATALGDWEDLKRIMSFFLAPKDDSRVNDATSLHAMTRTDWASWQAYLQSHQGLGIRSIGSVNLPSGYSRFTSLAELWFLSTAERPDSLLAGCVNHWLNHMTDAFCFDDLKESLLSLPISHQLRFREQCLEGAKIQFGTTDGPAKHQKWLNAEVNSLKFEYLLTAGQNQNVDPLYLRELVSNALRLHELQETPVMTTLATLLCAALIRWHELDPSGGHLLEATAILETYARNDDYQAKVLLVYLYTELGLYSNAILYYDELSIKELQLETFSHSLLPRISIGRPFIGSSLTKPAYRNAADLIDQAMNMYISNKNKTATFSKSLISSDRPDMILELQDLRRTLIRSITLRITLLEDRRVRRFTNRPQMKNQRPRTYETWQQDLVDNRDYRTTANLEAGDKFLDSKFLNVRRAPNTKWLLYNLLIEETWSWLQNVDHIVQPFMADHVDLLNELGEDSSLTTMEHSLMPFWKCLGALTMCGKYAVLWQKLDPVFVSYLDLLEHSFIPTLPISQVLDSKPDPAGPPTAILIQSIYLLFDYLRALNLFLNTYSKQKTTQSVLPKSRAQPMLSQVQKLFNELQKYAKKQRADLNTNTISAAITKSVVAGQVNVADHTKLVLDSATDTWDGVLKVQLDAPTY